jgi:serine/threonine protein phosphatase PrpC
MNVRVGSATDIGQVREGNEDSYLVVAPLYAVADGMGGHRGGEVASNLALDTVQQLFERREGTLADQVAQANRAVYERSQSDRSVSGMGTTLTAAMIDGDTVHLVHVGDSRAYLLRDGHLTQLTEDHTLVHRMVMDGEITPEEAETHPHRSILTRALGVDEGVQVDEGDVRIETGDRLLLCTDGLTGMVPEEQITEIMLGSADPQEAVDSLVKVANRAGGIDNITAVVLDFDENGSGRGATTEAALPNRPTVEQSVPSASPSDRSAITIVGAPISRTPPEDSASASSSSPRSTTSSLPAARPTPAGPRSHRGRTVGIWTGVTISILVLGLVGLRLFLDTQWYVGVSDGRVAIFRGVPTEVAGFELHTVVVETSLSAAEAEAFVAWRGLPDGITTDDRMGANAVVEQIRRDLDRAEQPAS